MRSKATFWLGSTRTISHFYFSSSPDAASARTWLGQSVEQVATTAEVVAFNDLFKRLRTRRGRDTGVLEATWMNLAFTHAGFKTLGVPDDQLAAFPPEFQEGLAARATSLGHVGASDAANWEEVFRDPDLHGVMILAADDPDDLQEEALRYVSGLPAAGIHMLAKFDGHARTDQRGHEHFGFKDGISQPAVKGFTETVKPGQAEIEPGEFVVGYPVEPGPPQPPPAPTPNQYGQAPAPAPDPVPGPGAVSTPTPSWTQDGSYLAFERLKQDVKKFHDQTALVALAQNRNPELVEAKLVGRHRSGCPLEAIASLPNLDTSTEDLGLTHPEVLEDDHVNDFVYEPDDADGTHVPRAAHIRKTNPRTETTPGGGDADTRRHRMLRRGIAFGESFREEAPVNDPAHSDSERGLLFLAYQSSLARQFEVVQGQWVNNNDFPQPGDGGDAILSENGATLRVPGFDPDSLTFEPFVTMTGGAYLFAPAISALRSLSTPS